MQQCKQIQQKQPKIGLIFGKFYPLHLGHLYLIEKASVQVDVLHVFLGVEQSRDEQLFKKSHLPKQPTNQDRFNWLQSYFNGDNRIKIHLLDESGIEFYPNGWQDWSNRVKTILAEKQIKPTMVFTSEAQDKALHELHFNCEVTLIDVERDFMPISATKIRENPYSNWLFLPTIVQSFFMQPIAIVINKDQNDQNKRIAQKLATLFNVDCFDLCDSSSFAPELFAQSKSTHFVAPFSLYLIHKNSLTFLNSTHKIKHFIEFNSKQTELEQLNEGINQLKPFSLYSN